MRRLRQAGWIGTLLLVVAVGAATDQPSGQLLAQLRPEVSPILAAYDFERPTPSGPDTFWARQSGGSEVALSQAFRVSGERSLHISEVPGNRDFAEFLAYFRECEDGAVFIQFYLLLTDPEQRFNFGLAGQRWFLSRERHGHAVWLQTDDGVFRHQTADGWRQLFVPRPFAWHFVDIVYHVDRGRYDLAIWEEGLENPLVDLRGIRAMHGQDHSAVKFFSLIGDLEDAGRFDFFVDDLLIAVDPAVRQEPFVAPGRRRWFVDLMPAGPRPARSLEESVGLFWRARRWLDELNEETGEAARDRLEAAADEAFHAGELDLAEAIYERLLEDPGRRLRMLLKLSDVEHVRGDVAAERTLREQIYGRIDFEERQGS